MLEIVVVLLVLIGTGFLIGKKVHASAALLAGGLTMLMASYVLGHGTNATVPFEPSGNGLVDQLVVVQQIIVQNLSGSGLIIMVLFGYTAYMEVMGANSRTVDVLSRPLLSMRGAGRVLLVPLTFLIANLMSLAVPSGSSLAVLLGATLFPALVGAGLTPLTAGALIATSATIMPSPLAADSIEAASQLGMSIGEYTFAHNAKVSLPAILVMAVVHTLWQRRMDARDERRGVRPGGVATTANGGTDTKVAAPAIFAILPVLPLLMVLLLYVLEQVGVLSIQVGLIQVTFIAMAVALVMQIIRRRNIIDVVDELKSFFQGMGRGLTGVVSLIMGAGMLVEGIKQTGVLDRLLDAAGSMSGGAFAITLVFVAVALLLAVLTGSGLAAFFSLVPIVPGIADRTGIIGTAITLPLQHTASLARAGSPVSASTLIVCGLAKVEPQQLLARTWVPIGSGILTSVILSWTIL